mgnify:CR=1 FL=1
MNIKNATYRRFGLTFPDEFPEDGERLEAGEWVCGVGSGLSKIALTFHLPGHKLEERAWMYFRL